MFETIRCKNCDRFNGSINKCEMLGKNVNYWHYHFERFVVQNQS